MDDSSNFPFSTPAIERPPPPALVLRRGDIATLMDSASYLAAVEAAFRACAEGDTSAPVPLHIALDGGSFHGKGALVRLDRAYLALKANANLPHNPQTRGLPTIQGVVLLFDAASGVLLAVMDSIEITLRRTAAATALAARYLARSDASAVAICGCGEQGRAQLRALADVVRIGRVAAWDADAGRAERFASEMRASLGVEVVAVPGLRDATAHSDIVVTATSAQAPFLTRDCVSEGAFIAAVGADSPHKSEIAPALLAGSRVVVDSLAQCAAMGDLHHALDAGVVTPSHVHAELGDLAVGRKHGRSDATEITLFDSTGVAIQDAASAAWIYRRAIDASVGTSVSFGNL